MAQSLSDTLVAGRMQHGDIEIASFFRRRRVQLPPHVSFGFLTQPAQPEEASFDHQQDGQLLLSPEIAAGDSDSLVGRVHHRYEHVHQQNDGDDCVEDEQQLGEHRMSRSAHRLFLIEVGHDAHHVVEHLHNVHSIIDEYYSTHT